MNAANQTTSTTGSESSNAMTVIPGIPHAADQWSDATPGAPDWAFRTWPYRGINCLWRINRHPGLMSPVIHRIPMKTRLAREWLEVAGYSFQ